MENESFLEKLASQFSQNALIKNVYGDPVTVGDKTIITVTEIAFGFGGGYGQKNKGKFRKIPAVGEEALLPDEKGTGEGSGGGGGMYIKPKGVYEITPTGTRFIQARSYKPLLVGLCIGFLIRGWIYAGRKKKSV